VFIDDITKDKKGLACNCICLHCKSDLIARLGEERVEHFAHYQNSETEGCKESALHMYGKYVLSRLSYFNVKPIVLDGTFEDKLGRSHSIAPTKVFGDKKLEILSTTNEKKIGNIRSDVFIETRYELDNLDFNIEIKVTHKIDSTKKAKLEKLKLNTLEIDLSKLLKVTNLTFDVVKKELELFKNQKIIYISQSFISQYETKVNEKKRLLKEEVNKKIDDWLINTEIELCNDGLCLPSYDYNFEKIPLTYEKEVKETIRSEGLDRPFKTNVIVDVLNFKHIYSYMFELTLLIKNKEIKLPVVASDIFCEVLDEPYFDSQSHLKLSILNFTSFSSSIDLKWGENQKADKFEKKYNLRVKEILIDIKKYGNRKISNLISNCKDLVKSNSIQYCNNYTVLKQRAQFYFEELNVSKEFLRKANELLNESLDNSCIYGCESRIWQMNLVWDLVHSKDYMVDIRFLEKRLNLLSIDLVQPFKELIELSKSIPKANQSYPFTPPQILLRGYFKHLCKVGLLSEYDENKYIISIKLELHC